MGAIKIFADHSSRQLLQANGLGDLDAIFAQADAVQVRHAGRGVLCRNLTVGCTEPTTVFLKMNWGRRRLWPRLTDLRNGQYQKTLPEREWDGLALCARLGIHVPQRLALMRDGLLHLRAAVLLCKVPPDKSLDDMLSDGTWARLPAGERNRILAELVETMTTIHRAGLGWRGTGSRHFFPEKLAGGSRRLWIIDCEGIHAGLTARIVERDYNKLLSSMKDSGADARTLERLQSLIAPAAIVSEASEWKRRRAHARALLRWLQLNHPEDPHSQRAA